MFEQERFVGRLQRHVLTIPDLPICFLAGSFGRRAEDAYSDVDVVLLYRDGPSRERAWERRVEFAREVMPYVPARSFDAEHVRPYLHVALYSNGTKADYLYETADAFQPNPWAREIRILKDNQGWAEQFQTASARLAFPQPYLSLDELVALDNRFWVMLWDVLRRLRRGDADGPFSVYLEMLEFTLPPLLAVLPSEDPARQALVAVEYGRDTRVTARHLLRLLEAYLAARAAVVRRQNLTFTVNTAFESEIRRLAQKLTG